MRGCEGILVRPQFFLFLLIFSFSCHGRTHGNKSLSTKPVDPRVSALSHLVLLVPVDGNLPPFFMDRFEVTQVDYSRFLSATGRPLPGHIKKRWKGKCFPPDQEKYWPVSGVTPLEARAYARWRGMRLPLLEEWEWAVGTRNGKMHSFPWGNNFDKSQWDELKCNTGELGLGRPANVGTFELGATKGTRIYDLIGNVAEWVVAPPSYSSYSYGRGIRPGGMGTDIDAAIIRRFLLAMIRNVIPSGGWLLSEEMLIKVYPFGKSEWDAVNKQWIWVGWHYLSRMERIRHEIPGRTSRRKGGDEWASTVGFRCAAWPEEMFYWLASREGPDIGNPMPDILARFIERYKAFFRKALKKPTLRELDEKKFEILKSLLK